MIRRKQRILTVLSWIHAMLLVQSIYVAVSCFLTRENTNFEKIIPAVVFAVCIIITYMCVRHIKQLWLYVIAAVFLVLGVHVLTKDLLATIVVTGVCFWRMLIKIRQGSIRKKMQELPGMAGAMEEKEFWQVSDLLDVPGVMGFLIWIALYVMAALLKDMEAVKVIFALLSGEALVCFVYHYWDRMLEFTSHNKHVANFPVKRMQRIAVGMIGMGLLILMIAIIPAVIYQQEPLANLNIKLEENEFEREMQEEIHKGQIEAEQVMEAMEQLRGDVKETPQWLLNVSKIAAFLFLIIVIVVLFGVVIRIVRKAVSDFSEDETDEIIFLRGDTEEIPFRKKREKNEKGVRNSPEQKIRRAYKKMIRRELKETLTGCETPSEIERKAGIEKTDYENASEAHDLYEKARYHKPGSMEEEAKKYMHIFKRTDRS